MSGTDSRIRTCLSILTIFGALTALTACNDSGPSSGEISDSSSSEQSVTIKRDGKGVPHIYADNTESLFYGYGYAVATDRLFQMEMAKRAVLGQAAEVLGPDYLASDIANRERFQPESIKAQIAALPKKDKAILKGYAEGFNARIKEVLSNKSNLLPKQFTQYGFEPEAWSSYDVAMIFVGTMANRYSASDSEISNQSLLNELQQKNGVEKGKELFDQVRWLNDTHAPTTVPRVNGLDSFAATDTATADKIGHDDVQLTSRRAPATHATPVSKAVLKSANALNAAWDGVVKPEHRPTASNAWVVGPNKTADGSTMLVNGPQFGWFNPAYVYSVGLHGAGYNVTGNTPFALPAILFGTNGTIAWGSTAGPLDVNDIYEYQINPDNQYQYRNNGAYRAMKKRTETIDVKDQQLRTVDIYYTVHGRVTRFDLDNSTAYAVKHSWSGHELQSLMAWVHSMQAKNWQQWLDQASQVAITINWYYADASGNIGYVSPGRLPVRPAKQDIRLPAKGDGSMEWQGFKPFSDNPKVFNPAQGFIANWNNQPAPSAKVDTYNWGALDRVNEIIARIDSKPQLTRDDVWNLVKATSFADLNARYFVPYIADAAQTLDPGSPAAKAASRLSSWDGLYTNLENAEDEDTEHYTKPAATILDTWLQIMFTKVLADDLPESFELTANDCDRNRDNFMGSSAHPGMGSKLLYNALLGDEAGVKQTIDFFNGVNKNNVINDALQKTVNQLTQQYGADQSTWHTQVHRQRFARKNFLGVPQAGRDEVLHLPTFMNRGTENDRVTFGRNGNVALCTVTPPGQSGFISPNGKKSSHYSDQLAEYKSFKCLKQKLTARALGKDLESSKTLTY